MKYLFFVVLFSLGDLYVHALTACPDNWIPYNGSCYYFSRIIVDYSFAESYCQKLSANLVHMNTQAENAFIKGVVSNFQYTSWWLGLSDREQEGVFTWVDDQTAPLFTDWYPGQPNGQLTDEDCTTLYRNYGFRWSDYNCSAQTSHPLCEMRGINAGVDIVG